MKKDKMKKDKKLKLSVAIICKNEKDCIERLLKSVVGADEIIICDTGSTDNTIEIAKKYTDKIYTDYKWEDSFCKARNYVLSKATGDWILSIDCDEWLMPDGIARIRKAIKIADENNQRTINVIMEANIVGDEFYFPRLFKRCKEVYWCGAIHNYLSITDNNKSDIRIIYSYSNAHDNDPDRALRILKREVKNNPKLIRETFYLAREYWYRKDYITASFWYREYIARAYWEPEWAEGYLMLSRCLWELDKNSEAKDACLQALKINAGYQEAIEFMADLCGKNNRAQWLLYANLAKNENLLTLRGKKEKDSKYYNNLFSNDSNMSRYYHLYNEISKLCFDEKVLDVGCGTATLQSFIKNYSGVDFAEEAVKIANNKNVKIGDAYNLEIYKGDYQTYIFTEVLEHLDDEKILSLVPKGKRVICSIPSFDDEAHLRTYTEKIVRVRFERFLKISNIIRFNWHEGEWHKGEKETEDYILLIDSVKI